MKRFRDVVVMLDRRCIPREVVAHPRPPVASGNGLLGRRRGRRQTPASQPTGQSERLREGRAMQFHGRHVPKQLMGVAGVDPARHEVTRHAGTRRPRSPGAEEVCRAAPVAQVETAGRPGRPAREPS